MDEARAQAQVIADKSPLAIRLAKHAMNAIEFMDLRDGYRFEQNMTHELTGSDDAKRGGPGVCGKTEACIYRTMTKRRDGYAVWLFY